MYSLIVWHMDVANKGLATEYSLDTNITMGRQPTCDIHLSVKFISRIHCTLILMPPELGNERPYYLIKDGCVFGDKSANGTWVNEERINQKKLNHQDVITFGINLEYPKAIFIDNRANTDAGNNETIEHERSSF